jgi:hypothetical protein
VNPESTLFKVEEFAYLRPFLEQDGREEGTSNLKLSSFFADIYE